ncbi:hypothetical protein AB2B41_00920 [Marimonas sp. MJW-29]|uniref:SPW repeat-containing protein n=1 Tax=Sulfitobacter sediminis TaxID=3234186 RepID=A0ABV3RGQ8_9RHOB
MPKHQRPVIAALLALIVLQLIMLSALYAGVPPHPPVATPLFGIAPFIGMSVAVALAALVMGPADTSTGRILSGLAVLCALVSFGPQKYLDPQFALIWPAVLTGQVAALVVLASVFGVIRADQTDEVARHAAQRAG